MVETDPVNPSLFLITILLLTASGKVCAQRWAYADGTGEEAARVLYRDIFPDNNKPDFEVFHFALRGYDLLQDATHVFRRSVITIIDFSRPSTVNRLWVIDLEKKAVVLNTLVAHGRNSGELVPERFSNKPNSFQSSLGFYVTGSTYSGKHGMSLLLEGLESDINDQARRRAIVVHGADYVSDKFIKHAGRLGRSQGCPAVPLSVHKQLIAEIKDRTCIFIYSPDSEYFRTTKLLRAEAGREMLMRHRSYLPGSF